MSQLFHLCVTGGWNMLTKAQLLSKLAFILASFWYLMATIQSIPTLHFFPHCPVSEIRYVTEVKCVVKSH